MHAKYRVLVLTFAGLLTMSPSPALTQDAMHPFSGPFFAVNPAFRADVLAQQAVAREADRWKWEYGLGDVFPDLADATKAHENGKMPGIGWGGLKMSLSRFDADQSRKTGAFTAGDENTGLEKLWLMLLHGSLEKEDWESLGDLFRPQLELGIAF